MFDKIQFHHFYSIKNFLSLQQRFAAMDYYQEFRTVKFNIPKQDINIITLEYDTINSEHRELHVNFHRNYLLPKLADLATNYLDLVKSGWIEKNIFTSEARRESAKLALTNLRIGLKEIENVDFLDDEVIKLILEQKDVLEDRIQDVIKNPYPEIKEKISFNWPSSDIEYFFHLLRANKQIKNINDADLGRIIDNFFEYKGEDETYHSIKGSRKHLSAFNKNSRSVNKPNARLIKVFNPDFFNI